MIKTRIEITPYLAEYLTCKFYDPESGHERSVPYHLGFNVEATG